MSAGAEGQCWKASIGRSVIGMYSRSESFMSITFSENRQRQRRSDHRDERHSQAPESDRRRVFGPRRWRERRA